MLSYTGARRRIGITRAAQVEHGFASRAGIKFLAKDGAPLKFEHRFVLFLEALCTNAMSSFLECLLSLGCIGEGSTTIIGQYVALAVGFPRLKPFQFFFVI